MSASTATNQPKRLTAEQAAIIGADVPVLKVPAYAGTGKTFVLVERARARLDDEILYIAFNKSIQLEAEARFANAGATNVKARTGNAVAYRTHALPFRDKLTFDLRHWEVRKLPEMRSLNGNIEHLKLVMDTLKNYLQSADDKLEAKHVPEEDNLDTPERARARRGAPPSRAQLEAAAGRARLRGRIAELAEKLWQRMKNPKDLEVKMIHDGYVKLWALSRPQLPYAEVHFDEVQDTNPVMQRVMQEQLRARIVLVGDEFQGIYAFRGALNAMATMHADLVLPLTQSWRFGQPVADVANSVLALHGRDDLPPLRGNPAIQSRLNGFHYRTASHAFVSRTNAGIIANALYAVQDQRPIAFVGGIDGYPFGKLRDVYNLWNNNHAAIQDPGIRQSVNFEDYRRTSQRMGDNFARTLIKLVEVHGGGIPALLDGVTNQTTSDPAASPEFAARGGVVLTTAHKCKGLEFSRVRLGEDYMNPMDDKGEVLEEARTPDGGQELNMIYVAATRAENDLLLNEVTRNAMRFYGPQSQRVAALPARASAARVVEEAIEEEEEPDEEEVHMGM